MAYSNLHPSYYHPITNPIPNPSSYYPSHTPPFYSTTTPPTFIHTLQQQTCVSPNSFYHQHPPQNQISNHFPWVSHPPFNISHTTTPQQPSSSPSPSPNPYISSPSPQTLPPSRLETKLSNFDGSEDAYWWIICSEKSFNNRNHSLSDAEKIIESILALRGAALTWWFSWFPTHRRPCWDSFTCGLLRQFKPEWIPILPIDGEEEDAKDPTESEEVLEPLEEEKQVKDEEKVKTESEKENNPSPIPPEIGVFTVSDLPSPKSPEPNPPETKSPENSFFIMLPPPPKPPDLQFPSERFSAPPPAIRPPLKPPDPSPSFLISQSHLRTPLCFSKSPLINSLPRPPENVSSLTLAPPPSLKPPFTNQTLSQPPNSSPSLLRPPAKPPDLKSGVELQLIMPMVKHKYCLLSFLHRDTQRVFALSDQQGASTNESQPCIQITIRLQPSPPTASCHVSNCLSPTFTQARDVGLGVLVFLPISIFHVPVVVLLQDFKSTPSLCDTISTNPFTTSHVFGFPPFHNPICKNKIQVMCKQLVSTETILGRQTMAQSFCYAQIFMDKNHVLQASPQLISVDLLHIRPARKPPDSYPNLEDKVQVNPAAMIEDYI